MLSWQFDVQPIMRSWDAGDACAGGAQSLCLELVNGLGSLGEVQFGEKKVIKKIGLNDFREKYVFLCLFLIRLCYMNLLKLICFEAKFSILIDAQSNNFVYFIWEFTKPSN